MSSENPARCFEPAPTSGKPAKLQVAVTLSGPMASEVRRICDNLDIGVGTFVKKAIRGELRAMGIIVE